MSEVSAEPKSAVKSLTLQSLVTVAISIALSKLGAALPEGAVREVAGAAIDFVSMIGLLGAAVGRARAKGPVV